MTLHTSKQDITPHAITPSRISPCHISPIRHFNVPLHLQRTPLRHISTYTHTYVLKNRACGALDVIGAISYLYQAPVLRTGQKGKKQEAGRLGTTQLVDWERPGWSTGNSHTYMHTHMYIHTQTYIHICTYLHTGRQTYICIYM